MLLRNLLLLVDEHVDYSIDKIPGYNSRNKNLSSIITSRPHDDHFKHRLKFLGTANAKTNTVIQAWKGWKSSILEKIYRR